MGSTFASRVMTLLVAAQLALCVAGVATVLMRDRASSDSAVLPQMSETPLGQDTARS
jgi:hypothetical protein